MALRIIQDLRSSVIVYRLCFCRTLECRVVAILLYQLFSMDMSLMADDPKLNIYLIRGLFCSVKTSEGCFRAPEETITGGGLV